MQIKKNENNANESMLILLFILLEVSNFNFTSFTKLSLEEAKI